MNEPHLSWADAPDPQWMEHAACRGESGDLFFPDRYENAGPAKAICFRCPVRKACLDFALDNHIEHGIWGMTSRRDRQQIRRNRRMGLG